jgi:hypothetical protein
VKKPYHILRASNLINIQGCKSKVKLSLLQPHRVVRHSGSHIFYTIGSQMAVRFIQIDSCERHFHLYSIHIVTYEGFAWLIIMDSGLYDWIYWHLQQTLLITINYKISQSMTVSDSLHSLLDYECLLFCVTDLVLIYELVTSSAFIVNWLTLHSWTLNFWILLWLTQWTLLNWGKLLNDGFLATHN